MDNLSASPTRGREFTSEEFQLFNIISSIVSTIYNNSLAKAYKEKRIKFLNSITELQTADLDVLFRNFLVGLSEIVPSRFISLWLFNELDDTLVIRSFYPSEINGIPVEFSSFDNTVIRCPESLSGLAVKSKRPMNFPQTVREERFQNPKFAAKYGLKGLVCVPVLDLNKNPLAVVNLCPVDDIEDFTDRVLDTLFGFITPVANTIRLASLLFEENLLFAYDEFFNSMIKFQDQQRSWDELACLIRDRMKCEACSIFLAGPDEMLHLKGTTGLEHAPPLRYCSLRTRTGTYWYSFREVRPSCLLF